MPMKRELYPDNWEAIAQTVPGQMSLFEGAGG